MAIAVGRAELQEDPAVDGVADTDEIRCRIKKHSVDWGEGRSKLLQPPGWRPTSAPEIQHRRGWKLSGKNRCTLCDRHHRLSGRQPASSSHGGGGRHDSIGILPALSRAAAYLMAFGGMVGLLVVWTGLVQL